MTKIPNSDLTDGCLELSARSARTTSTRRPRLARTRGTRTKFSFTAGVGAKTFFGDNQKVGLRMQFRVLPTFYNTFATVGTGGVDIRSAFVGVKAAAENFLEIKVLSTGFALLIRRPPVVRTCDI